jgi:hypothetical protein
MAGARQSNTGDIKQNATDSTFLSHTFLVRLEIWQLLILPDYPEDCEERGYFLSSMTMMRHR